jgi:transposase InsO family protein
MHHEIVLQLAEDIRKIPQCKKMGTAKLYRKLKPQLDKMGIKMGRVALNDLLSEYGLLVRRRRRKRVTTTCSDHPYRKYSNLIIGLVPQQAGIIWVADITYLHAGEDFAYLFLITDLYSRKIIGYCLALTLEAKGAIAALNMALHQWEPVEGKPLIHHSDRGMQYCCNDYVTSLKNKHIQISMAAKGNPYQNAVAERVNGILKDEMALDRLFEGFEQALEQTQLTIAIYNNERLHSSINHLVPAVAHTRSGILPKKW